MNKRRRYTIVFGLALIACASMGSIRGRRGLRPDADWGERATNCFGGC